MAERFTEELLREVWNEAMRQQAEPYVLQERAAIVAWLRRLAVMAFKTQNPSQLADKIEAGRHLK